MTDYSHATPDTGPRAMTALADAMGDPKWIALQTNKGLALESDAQGSPRHLPALDGLRGVAILLVLVVHFYQRSLFENHPLLALALGRVAATGAYGVQLFFVLSGFLITGILIDNKDRPGSLFKFYARRCLRIFPLYYLALTIVFVILPNIVAFDKGAENIATHQLWLWTYFANWPSLGWIWDDSSIFLIGHFWSLCVEEHFYILWPALVYLFSGRNLAKACVTIVFVGMFSRTASVLIGSEAPIILQWLTLQKIDGLAIGSLLAVAIRDVRLHAFLFRPRLLFWGTAISATLFACLAGMPRRVNIAAISIVSETIIVAFFAFALLRALQARRNERLSRVLNSRLLMSLGKYSYGIYVIHGLLRPQFVYMMDVASFRIFPGSPILYQTLFYCVMIGVSFLLAYISFHWFEKHFLAMKRYVSYSEAKGEDGARSGS